MDRCFGGKRENRLNDYRCFRIKVWMIYSVILLYALTKFSGVLSGKFSDFCTNLVLTNLVLACLHTVVVCVICSLLRVFAKLSCIVRDISERAYTIVSEILRALSEKRDHLPSASCTNT